MKKPLVIFGTGSIAELAYYYFSNDSDFTVAGFTVDDSHLLFSQFKNLPVVGFSNVEQIFSPSGHSAFVALSYSQLNKMRQDKFESLRSRGYNLASYISSRSTILNDGKIGNNCFILENSVIQPFVTIGDNVTIWSGSIIGHHSSIASHCFLAPNVAVSGNVDIGESCFLGISSTLRNGIRVGARCVIGAGSVILSDTEPEGVYVCEGTPRSSDAIRRNQPQP